MNTQTQKLLKGIDINEIVKRIVWKDNFFREVGIFTHLIKTIVEEALSTQIDSYIAQDASKGKQNRKNVYTSKKVKSLSDSFDLDC